MARPERRELEDFPARPRGISEVDLFQAYSGLRRPAPLLRPTPETVRRSLAAAGDADPVDGADTRDDVAAEARP